MARSPRKVPVLLTIDETARALRVSKSTAYARARLWEQTGGRAGLPSVRVRGSLRVRSAELQQQLGRPLPLDYPEQPGGRPASRTATPENDDSDRDKANDNNCDDHNDHAVNDHALNDHDPAKPLQSNDPQTSHPVNDRFRAVPTRAVNTCHPSWEAASAPAAPPPAGPDPRWSRGVER